MTGTFIMYVVHVRFVHSMCATCIIIMYVYNVCIFFMYMSCVYTCTRVQYTCTHNFYKNITPVIFPSSIFLHQPSSSNLSSLLLFLCATSN